MVGISDSPACLAAQGFYGRLHVLVRYIIPRTFFCPSAVAAPEGRERL